MDRVYRFSGVFVIFIILISESRQTQEDDELNRKISEIFGTSSPDIQTTNPYPNPNSYSPLTESPPTVPYSPVTTQRTETLSSSSPSENNVQFERIEEKLHLSDRFIHICVAMSARRMCTVLSMPKWFNYHLR